MKRTALVLLVLLIGAVVASGCLKGGEISTTPSPTQSRTTTSPEPPETTTPTPTETERPYYPITVTDFANRTVTLEKAPERVVTLAPSITEDLYYLGLFDRVVGVTDYDDFPPEVANVTRIGGYGKYANLEVIASLEPDLILADSYSLTILEDLEKIAPVVIVDPHGLNDIPRALELLGQVFDAKEQAEKAIVELRAGIEGISSAVKEALRLKVFYVVWNDPLMTAGGGTFISDVIELAGGENIFNDTTGWPQVSFEQVLERNPDVIILTPHCGMKVEDVYNTPLADTNAARNGRVYMVENENDIIHSSPRVVRGLETLARLLHPEAFKVEYPLTVTDFAGREVTIEKEPERIVSLAPSITESLFYIGAGDKLVGVTQWADFPPAVRNITKVGGYGKYANLEIIASLEPDLILVDGLSVEVVEALEEIAPVVVINPNNITAIYDALELLGKITNREEGAGVVIAEMKGRVSQITSAVEGQPRPRTFFILSYYNGYWTTGAGTFMDDLIALAGGENIFNDLSGWGAANEEQIIARNPEVIIISPNAGIKPEDLCSGLLSEVDAVKNGRVYLLSDENLVVRPGPRIVDGLEEIAKLLHPGVFNYQPEPLVCSAGETASQTG